MSLKPFTKDQTNSSVFIFLHSMETTVYLDSNSSRFTRGSIKAQENASFVEHQMSLTKSLPKPKNDGTFINTEWVRHRIQNTRRIETSSLVSLTCTVLQQINFNL